MSVVILGMHRSGTSLLVGLLELHGFYLGDVSSKTSEFKPTGTKENLSIRKINNKLFSAAHSDWRDPAIPDTPSPMLIDEILRVAVQFNHHTLWSLKDPRMVFTYPIWKNFLPKHKIIGTYRKPIEVAYSLQLKNNISINEGLKIWYKYNTELLKTWQQNAFPVIPFIADKPAYLKCFSQILDFLNIEYKKGASEQFYQHKKSNIDQTMPIPEKITELDEAFNRIIMKSSSIIG